jgi:hypothetical protein
MKRIRIYRNPACARCARMARMHQRLDWLDRVEVTTQPPPGRAPLKQRAALPQAFCTTLR